MAAGAGVGSPRRSAPISVEKRDGSDQFMVWADSSQLGSPARARPPPQRRSAGPCCSNAINTIFIGPQLSLTASESERATWRSLAAGTKAESDAGATAIGRCGSHVYRVSVSSRWMPADESLMTTRGRREWGAGFAAMCLAISLPAAVRGLTQLAHFALPVPRWHRSSDRSSPPCPMLSRHAETSAGFRKHTVRLPFPPPLAPPPPPRRRQPPAGLEMRKKAADRSSDVQVATTKPPKRRAMLTMSAHLNLWTSNLVGGRGPTPPGGGSRRGHPGAAWEQLKCLDAKQKNFTTIVLICCEIHNKL